MPRIHHASCGNGMLVIVTYDVSTETAAGRRRLRKVAQICTSYGQRAQKSVFECSVGQRGLALMRGKLLETIEPQADSLRLYFINDEDRARIEQYGQSGLWDFEGPLVV